MSLRGDLKYRALHILLKETFSYIDQNMYNDYVQLAYENKKVLGIKHHGQSVFFMYQGTVYPNRAPNGLSITEIKVNAPILHWSLIQKFDNITAQLETAGYTTIKNFLSTVLSFSFNNIVLDTFIPTVLMTKLRKELNDYDYHVINYGTEDMKPFQEIELTKKNIVMIQEHYQEAITKLKDLLMQRFLLQE